MRSGSTPFYPLSQMHRSGTAPAQNFLRILACGILMCALLPLGTIFQSSLETASLLKELGAKKWVARAARDVQAKFLLRNGADEVVYPEKQMAFWTAIRYSSDHIF